MLFLTSRALKAINTGIFLVIVSYSAFGDTEVWRLDLATESQKVGPEAFAAWMAKKGFQPFKYLFFKCRPEL